MLKIINIFFLQTASVGGGNWDKMAEEPEFPENKTLLGEIEKNLPIITLIILIALLILIVKLVKLNNTVKEYINKNNSRGFKKVNDELDTLLPTRQTKSSAGYDFYVIEDVVIPAHKHVLLPTNAKAYMQDDEVLMLYARSSLAIKRGLVLKNMTGIIDSDFYPNEIKIALENTTNIDVTLTKNERIAQGIFLKYLVSDNGNLETTREGGIGSTGKK